jgi:hypothetical protein
MAVIEKEASAVQEGRRAPRRGWLLWAFVGLALVSFVVAALMVTGSREREPAARPAPRVEAGAIYTAREHAVLQLVAQGLIPAETLDGEPFRTKRLVNGGLVPREALAPWSPPVEPLYSARERALMAAVAAGQIPRQALDGEPFRTKELINRGLIPRAAAG